MPPAVVASDNLGLYREISQLFFDCAGENILPDSTDVLHDHDRCLLPHRP